MEPQPVQQDHLRPQWVRDDGFDLMCRRLFDVFPSAAPETVVDEGDGDYGHAQRAFRQHGSRWSCGAVFENRSVICFINAAAYLFLLPRLISCSLSVNGLNADIYSYVLFGLEARVDAFPQLFSKEQRVALIAPLQYLFGGVALEYGPSEIDLKKVQRIIAALRD